MRLTLAAAPLVTTWLAAAALAGCGPPSTPTPRASVIGATSVAIDGRITATRTGEAPLGDFVTDTLLDAVHARGEDAMVALLNAGSIRGGPTTRDTVPPPIEAKLGRLYPPGPLTDLDVEGWFPFRDDHVVMTVSAAALKSALERGASQLPADLLNDGGGPLLQIAGGAYTIDCAGAVQAIDPARGVIIREGTRVSRLVVGDHVVFDRDAGLDELAATNVRLVVNSFVADGFDGHLALLGGRDRDTLPYDDFDLAQILVARVSALSPIAPEADGRITILGDCGRPLTIPH
jgi:hypothetical protein